MQLMQRAADNKNEIAACCCSHCMTPLLLHTPGTSDEAAVCSCTLLLQLHTANNENEAAAYILLIKMRRLRHFVLAVMMMKMTKWHL